MKIAYLYISFILFACAGCKEKFVPNTVSPPTGYLVVEGYINSGPQPTSISLSRTTRLFDSVQVLYEQNAMVKVQNENLDEYPLFENANGIYTSASLLNLKSNEKYRVNIRTQDGKEYVSDFAVVRHTPSIDSISWIRNDDGVGIYVNTHDLPTNSKFFQWKFEETWEIHSAFRSTLKFVFIPATGKTVATWRDPFFHRDDTTIYKCWQQNIPSNIVLGSSEKLSINRIHFPLVSIVPQSEKLSLLYSIRVRQYALSEDAYRFYEKMKKNTELVGSIFDAQPAELRGNIHCSTDPEEVMVGLVDISEEQEQRIYISNAQLPSWNYRAPCVTVILDISGYDPSLIPINPHEFDGFGNIKNFIASLPFCVDCTTRGSNIKPAFWP